MSNLDYNKDEFKEIIIELTPSYQQEILLNALEYNTENEFEQLGLQLTGEKRKTGIILPTSMGSTDTNPSIWSAIKNEVYDYLCTKSRKYSKERNEAGSVLRQIITIISTAIGSLFSIAVGLVTGAVTIAIMSALKIGKNAWCNLNRPD